MRKQQTITGVVLTLNEENDLPRALSSLSWCDNLVVLDSGSTDTTGSIAQDHGARFIVHQQQPPFLITEQRNWLLDQEIITTEWILFLDADEEVGPQLRDSILSTINSSAHFNAYELTPRYWFLGKWLRRTQGYPNWHPRLLKRSSIRFRGGVWESFTNEAVVGHLSIPYEHYAFSKGLDDWIDRHQRYSSFEASQTDLYLRGIQSSYPTQRSKTARHLVSRIWPLRPAMRFIQKYLLQFGWTEGWQALLFCLLMSIYDFFIVVKIIQHSRLNKGLPL